MFERFTEKAINVISESQNLAQEMHNAMVQPEHLLLAIAKNAKGIPLKLFRISDVSFEELKKSVDEKLRFEKTEKALATVPFSHGFKNLLKRALDLADKSQHPNILFEHLFLAAITEEDSYNCRILKGFRFDLDNACNILTRLVQKKTKRFIHPESDDTKDNETTYLIAKNIFDGKKNNKILEKVSEKLHNSNYELVGTEQIIASILEDCDGELATTLNNFGINAEVFYEKLSQINSRSGEFESKEILLTPHAYKMMCGALQTAKELGSSEVTPEHIILSLLKEKKGIAYDVFNSISVDYENLIKEIIKPIEKQMPETLTILRFAKQEARRLGRNIVGTEMFLLGIINEATGVGARVLSNLEIKLKDARFVVENLIGYGNEYYDTEITFTKRAKKVLELAWNFAKNENKPHIESSHLLLAITQVENSLAMKALQQLGVDVVEIRQGIIKETANQ